MSKVILTGLRANNDLQLGNYLGAILPMVDLIKRHADEYQIHMFVPDLHSFTTPIDHNKLQANIMHNIRLFVAAGLPLDNDNIHLYRQSYVPAHSELTWILDCFAGYGELQRMTEFKDKSAKIGDDRISMGLFNYPVLMAADILLYDAAYVPVGDDQRQHLEFIRDIAERMNNQFGNLFTVPEPVKKQHEFAGRTNGLRIKDLQNPTKKMSKSDETSKGVIFLSDDPQVSVKKIMSAATDNLENIQDNPINQPGIANLLAIYEQFGGDKSDFIGTKKYGDFKKAVAHKVEVFLQSFQETLSSIDDQLILHKLSRSEAHVNSIANKKLHSVQKAIGLR